MTETPAAPTATPRTLLIVDDQQAVRTSIAYYLGMCGYRTFRAESGEAAIELLRKEQVDGVLMDVQMPVLNGFQTCVRLHALAREANRQIKVWFMTGINYRELRDECEKSGGEAVFQKPFDWPQLLAELDRGLASQSPSPNPSAGPDSPST